MLNTTLQKLRANRKLSKRADDQAATGSKLLQDGQVSSSCMLDGCGRLWDGGRITDVGWCTKRLTVILVLTVVVGWGRRDEQSSVGCGRMSDRVRYGDHGTGTSFNWHMRLS